MRGVVFKAAPQRPYSRDVLHGIDQKFSFESHHFILKEPAFVVLEDAAVCNVGGKWWCRITPLVANRTARSMQFSNSRTLPGQW